MKNKLTIAITTACLTAAALIFSGSKPWEKTDEVGTWQLIIGEDNKQGYVYPYLLNTRSGEVYLLDNSSDMLKRNYNDWERTSTKRSL